MKKGQYLFCYLFLVLFSLSSLRAADFGLILDQNVDAGGFGNDSSFTYSSILIPRFSAMFGDKADLFISAGFEASYNEKWVFVPELLRTELTVYSGTFDFTFGRMYYCEPLGFIADGLFDGARFFHHSEAGTFSFGVWYTGFLYKRRANIAMTPADLLEYSVPFEFNDFQNTYFAPRRLVAALGWERAGGLLDARFSILGQADLRDDFNLQGNNLLHSQYFIGQLSISGGLFGLDIGGAFGLVQNDGEFGMSTAAELGIALSPPTRVPNRFSFLARYTSGETGTFTAFEPITIVTQGEILGAKLSGLSTLTLDYFVRPHRTFAFGFESTYFIRTDFVTYMAYPGLNNSGNLLGNEFFAQLLWTPFSDMQINLGGGVFLPSLGNAAPNAETSWRVELNVIMSL